MSKRNSQLRGIVVAADTQEQALDHFRAVASGNYQTLESKDGEYAFATSDTVGIQIMNPLNGEEMVVVPDDEKHDMVATASAGSDMDVFYKVCASGCGSHVIADHEEILMQCPSCASALPPMEDAELKNKPAQPVQEVLLAVASSRKDVAKTYKALASGECETFTANCDGVMVISNQPLKYDIYKGTEAVAVDDYVPQMAVAANADGKIQAHYLTTAATEGAEGQLHLICSDESPVFCPATSSGLVDPMDALSEQERATAASDFEDEEEEEEDEEESEESEDDEEDEDEDEEDEEDDEEEDDEEDEEDLSLSLATSEKPQKSKTKKGGVRRKSKEAKEVATAASVPAQAAVETAPLTISFVAYASAENAMTDSSVDVAYIGNVQGDSTWIALHDGVPFAKATASNAENPTEFADASFGRAFKALASEQGVQAAMTQMRFEEIRPVVNVDQLVSSQIETRVQEATAEIAQAATRDTEELAQRFEAAIATAAQGINRGFFPDLKNPVRLALASTLEDLGVQGGDELLQRAFADHSDTHHKQILAKACEIMQFDLTVQNQLATAINDVQEVSVATAASMSIGRPVNQPVKQPVKQEQELSTAASVPTDFAAKLATLRFN